jgi:solute carrier family 35 protein F1/2
MASHFQEDLIVSKGDDMGTTHVQPKGMDASHGAPHSGPGNGLGGGGAEMAERGDGSVSGNPVLESVAQTKGTWFAYVKTKQFWLSMLLGQGM